MSKSSAKTVEMPEVQKIDKPAIILLVPSRTGHNSNEFASSLGATDGIPTTLIWANRFGVIEARNRLAKAAPMFPSHASFSPKLGWFVLWADDDAAWTSGTFLKMLTAMADSKIDIVAGWFCGRGANLGPNAFFTDGSRPQIGKNCERGDIVEVDRVGLHFVMHRLGLLKELNFRFGDDLFEPEGTDELGEDTAFCRRAREIGKRIWVHTDCPIAHVDSDGIAYIPGEGPMEVVGSQLVRADAKRSYGEGLDDQKRKSTAGIVLA